MGESALDMKGGVLMSGKDLRRLKTLHEVQRGILTQEEAAEQLSISERQVRRLLKKIKEKGDLAIVHGLKAKPSNNRLDQHIKDQVVKLWVDKYKDAGFNFSHFWEKLSEQENVTIGRETLRQLLRAKGLANKPPRKGSKHRRHRERKASVGELLQMDTSPHDWLGTGEKLHCVAIVDDATSALLFCRLFKHDGTLPNMEALLVVFARYGLPIAVYTDRASWFFNTPKHRTVDGPKPEENEVDKTIKTQIGRALEELGVEFIPAYSPQAKGRVERMNGTLQDRLIPELKLRKIKTIEDANVFIDREFISDHNRRFAVLPADANSTFIPIANADATLREILCQKFICTVANDNTVSRQNYFKIQIEKTEKRINWFKAKVEVRIYVNKTIGVFYGPEKAFLPFSIIEFKIPNEAKKPSEKSTLQKITA